MDEATRIAVELGNRERATPPSRFPADGAGAHPGLYAWWADDVAVDLLSDILGDDIRPLLYVGQAGATRWPSGKRDRRTVANRVLHDELEGHPEGATFRLSLTAILRAALALNVVGPKRLDVDSQHRLTSWMHDHLRVAIHPYHDRDTLERIKRAVLPILNPSLNLVGGVPPSRSRTRLRDLRRAVSGRG